MTANSFLGVHYGIWAAASLVIAIIYFFVWPRPVNDINSRPMWRHLVLRYFDSLVWLVMAISFIIRLSIPNPAGETLGDISAMLAFALYLVFLVTATYDRRAAS